MAEEGAKYPGNKKKEWKSEEGRTHNFAGENGDEISVRSLNLSSQRMT